MANQKKDNTAETIRKNIEQAHEYFKDNYERFRAYTNFIFNTTITNNEAAVLSELGKPRLEFNVLEAYINRLSGEFSKMDPAFEIKIKDNINLSDPRVVDVVEGHIKAAFKGGDQDDLANSIYRDMLSGGFSVAQIYTDYPDGLSFDPKIYIERVFDPTLCGFDPLARQPHKGDGRFCFQFFPMSYDEAVDMWGEKQVKHLKNKRYRANQFNWSYTNQNEKILLIAEYYCKRRKRKKVVKLTNGHVVEKNKYKKMLQEWDDQGILEQPPQIIHGKERMAVLEKIEKYTICGDTILEYKENTNFDHLPLVFFDGNSVMIRESANSAAHHMTRPYVYQATDTQKLKNFAGQTLAHEIENMTQHKWKAPIEGIPNDKKYMEAYKNPQKASVLIYNQFKDSDPNQQVNPPQEIQRTPIPNEVTNTFQMADQTIQAILGSYDATIGVNDKDISGKAIQEGAMQSNAAAMPYTTGFLNSWNRCAQVYLNLLPKYYVTPQSVPVIKKNGKRDVYKINKKPNVFFNYDVKCLDVKVSAGVSFAVQKQVALNSIIQLMQASEQFKEFMDEEGLHVLLDNLEIRGIDQLQSMADDFMQKKKQEKQQMAQQQAQEPSQAQIMQERNKVEAAKVQQRAQEAQQKHEIDKAKIAQDERESLRDYEVDSTEAATEAAVKQQENEMKFMEIMNKIDQSEHEQEIKEEKIDAEQTRSAVDMAINLSRHADELSDKMTDEIKDETQAILNDDEEV